MTAGTVVSIGADICSGWATIAASPRYAVTVHLVLDGIIRSSAIADRVAGEFDDPTVTGACWFELDAASIPSSRKEECRVLVGESGEYLSDSKRGNVVRDVSPASTQIAASYRDALGIGLSISDVIELLYLDILRRPADKPGLSHWVREVENGRHSFESFRRSSLASDEYRALTLRVRDAPGGTFGRRIVRYSSTRRRMMEQHVAAFQRLEAPLRGKLLDFFPGLVAIPGAHDRLVALADKGFPEREIFFRALSALSNQPSLIVADRVEPLHGPGCTAVINDAREISTSCASPWFALGWNRIESPQADPFRWMEQVGVILNPRPDQPIKRVELSVMGWYGPIDRTITAVAGDRVLVCASHEREGGGRTLLFTAGEDAPFTAPRIALVAAQAACPWRFDGTPDMRLLSCQVSGAKFVYAGGEQ